MKNIGLALVLSAITGSTLLATVCVQESSAFPGKPVRRAQNHNQAMGVNNRQNYQQNRITNGTTSGQLTATEQRRLQRQQTALAAREARFRSTGGLQPWERAKLDNQQDAYSRNIYKQKHDAQVVH